MEESTITLELKTESIVFMTIMGIIFFFGVMGNILVPLVIFHSKDLRNSTNVFLVNLAIADLLVILICLPTGFIELSTPGVVWLYSETGCLVVTFVELIAPHASVLTILAISFERYYAICHPLRAGYVCTKKRAIAISILTWIAAGILTSPIIGLTEFGIEQDESEPSCGPQRDNFWTKAFYFATFSIFFLIPCLVLLVLYKIIAQHLIREPSGQAENKSRRLRRRRRMIQIQRHQNSHRSRRQVVAMLGAVVLSFFVCLLPFRLLTLISIEEEDLSPEWFSLLVNFCRVMVYLNSAVNPILYNLLSSKFRQGFLRLFGFKKFTRQDTFSTSSTVNATTSSSLANTNLHISNPM